MMEYGDILSCFSQMNSVCKGFKVIRFHDKVIKWKHFLCYWPFVRGIHRLPVNYPHKVQWSGALMFSMICAWTNSWTNNGDTGDFRCHCAHYGVIVMLNSGQWPWNMIVSCYPGNRAETVFRGTLQKCYWALNTAKLMPFCRRYI